METETPLQNTVSISMEIELGWAKHDKGAINHLSKRRKEETEALNRLLSLCDQVEIPISFNIVGHLLLDECSGNHSTRPNASSWFVMDPGTDMSTDPEFYAPDLIENIRCSSVNHEICTHTFSHTPCGDVDSDIVRWELAKSRQVHTAVGLQWSPAMVPPRHSVPDYDDLLEYGINTLRIPVPKRTFQMNKLERFHHSLFKQHPTKSPKIENGVCHVYSSPYLSLAAPYLPHGQLDPHPVFRVIPQKLRKKMHRNYLQKALNSVVKKSQTAHFWSHLWDISNSVQMPMVEDFVRKISEEQKKENVDVIKLREIGERIKNFEK